MDKKIYMAYGTDIAVERMKRLCPEACLVGRGLLPDYKLTFKHEGLPHIKSAPGQGVSVIFWRISGSSEKRLDFYYKFPKIRKKIELKAQLLREREGKLQADFESSMLGYTYVMTEKYAQYADAPSKEDYICMFEAYVNYGFDFSVLPMAYEEALNDRFI